ncbi:MAG TPA: hypothetical protein DCZ40_09490, partial [Lachnospiraceae bacterium]|nr:hypothetical protein [Lachnospiraceae bacterium]
PAGSIFLLPAPVSGIRLPVCFFVQNFGWDVSKQKRVGVGTVRDGNKGHPCPVFPKPPVHGRFTLGFSMSFVKKHLP